MMNLKQQVPRPVKRWLRRQKPLFWFEQRRKYPPGRVQQHAPITNLYHCTIHKAASQWLRAIFSDPRVYAHCGLRPYTYQRFWPSGHDERPLTARTFNKPFPAGTILTPLYLDYASYRTIPKPAAYRTLYVVRDPRDILVSWYYSQLHSHPTTGKTQATRDKLASLSFEDGLSYGIEHLHQLGTFAAIDSWAPPAGDTTDPEPILRLRYRDLIGPQKPQLLQQIFDHSQIRLPDGLLETLLHDYSFSRLSGRQRGQENIQSHYRKGVADDWQDKLTETHKARLKPLIGQTLIKWQFETSLDW